MSGEGDGPRGTVPRFARRTLGLFTRRSFRYGPVARVRPGSRRLLLTDPEDVRHVLVSNAANYVKTPRLASERGRERAGSGLLTRVGEAHLERRRLLQPLFHRHAVDRFAGAIERRVEAWLSRRRDGETLDLAAEMAALTRDSILDILFGPDLDPTTRDRLHRAIAVRRRYTEHVYHGRLPFRDRLPVPIVRADRRAMETFDRIVHAAIGERRGEGARRDDLIGELVAVADRHGRSLTDREVRDEVLTFSSTGYETLGEALTWTWWLLAGHPAMEARFHARLDVPPEERDPSTGEAAWIGCTLEEALRLYPPTWIYARLPRGEDRLPSGFRVGGREILYLCPWVLHRHPAHFPQPERFDPDRFVDRERPPRYVYLPFGDGPHRCLGEHLARLEGVRLLARIGRRARFRPLEGDAVEPWGGVTLRPRNGLPARVELR